MLHVFYGSEISLSYLQLGSDPYSELDVSTSHSPTVFSMTHLSLDIPSGAVPPVFLTKFCTHFSSFSCAIHTPLNSFNFYLTIVNDFRSVRIMKLLIMLYFQLPVTSFLLRPQSI
jgi:hypothetical protein